ncbi:hypothetical protein [Pandoravirus japonicus]|uniref:Uncharacterized protein n=1 Tax=Pandoravirus japonicus TaxID=2823154 RepID=A0A811BQP3_9VIRU|nr:hypothetical protein [Pandoravirus japonicus]
MACARPLHVVLPACATDKIALPPAPVSAKYTAVFEVEFVNASPDTKIDLALAMRVDGHALLRNVQEVEADARRCVRLQVEVEVPKGHTASLSWRPFSRKPERLPAWLTIGRGEARMAISPPPQPPAQLQQQHPHAIAAPAPPTHNQGSAHDTKNNDNNSIVTNDDSATHLVSDDGHAGRRNKHRDRRRARETTRDDKPPRRRRRSHRRHDGADGDRRAKENEAGTDGATDGTRDRDVRGKHERRDRDDRHGGSDTKRRDRHRRDRGRERDQQSASRDATTAAVATALAAVAAARNAHEDEEDEEEDSLYCGDSESVSMLPVPPAMGTAPHHHRARMLVPITAVGHRLAARRY